MIFQYDLLFDPFDNKDLYKNCGHICTDKCNYDIVFAFSIPEVILSAIDSKCDYIKHFAYMAYLRRYKKDQIDKIHDPLEFYQTLISNDHMIKVGRYKYLTGLLDTIMDYDHVNAPSAAIAGSMLKMESMSYSIREPKYIANHTAYLRKFIDNKKNHGPVMANPNNADNIINTLSRCYDILSLNSLVDRIFIAALKRQMHDNHIFKIMNDLFKVRKCYEINGYKTMMKKLNLW